MGNELGGLKKSAITVQENKLEQLSTRWEAGFEEMKAKIVKGMREMREDNKAPSTNLKLEMLSGMRDILKENGAVGINHPSNGHQSPEQHTTTGAHPTTYMIAQERSTFPQIQDQRVHPSMGDGPTCPNHRNSRMPTTWNELPDEPHYLYDPSAHNPIIKMCSHYYSIRKPDRMSNTWRLLTTSICGGDIRMVLSYIRSGREQSSVVQLTCDVELEEKFLLTVEKATIRKFAANYNPLFPMASHPAKGPEREALSKEQARQVQAQ